MKTRARQLVVPTKLEEVVALLRNAGEPVTLFGERPEDRTDRLRHCLAREEFKDTLGKRARSLHKVLRLPPVSFLCPPHRIAAQGPARVRRKVQSRCEPSPCSSKGAS